jgi:hypothetical protein
VRGGRCARRPTHQVEVGVDFNLPSRVTSQQSAESSHERQSRVTSRESRMLSEAILPVPYQVPYNKDEKEPPSLISKKIGISWVGTFHRYDARGCARLECHARVCLTGAGEACGFHGYAIGWIMARKIPGRSRSKIQCSLHFD